MRNSIKLILVSSGLALLLALTLAAPQTRAASLWYVATTGNDASSCTSSAAPCATIGGVLAKLSFAAGDTIRVAAGTYTGAGSEVVLVNKSVVLSGGWNNTFTTQTGYATLEGNNARRGLTIDGDLAVTVDRFIIEHGYGEGGGVRNTGTLTLTNSSVRDNSANAWPWSGGGIYSAGALRIMSSTISGNISFHLGDGVVSYGTTIVDNSAILNNSGNGIFHSGNLTLTNSTISGNSGIALDFGGDATTVLLSNVTLAKNLVGFNTQGAPNVHVNARNSIIADNSSANCVGALTSLGYNIIGNTANCIITSGPGDQFNVDPGLTVLVGSPAFFPLLANSPAVNAGNPAGCLGPIGLLTTDQRGVARDAHCDIGAFEYVTPGPAVSLDLLNTGGHTLPPGGVDAIRFKVRLLDSQGNLVHNAVVTFTAPASGPSGIFATTGTNLATAVTGGDGVATAPEFTANTELGDYNVLVATGNLAPLMYWARNVIWYVSATNGSWGNTCISPTSPCFGFDQLLMASELTSGHQVRVAAGTYRGGQTYVLPLNRSLQITGGWNEAFTQQTGTSILDGDNARGGIGVDYGLSVTLERFAVRNALAGISSSAQALTFTQGSIQDSVQRGLVLSAGQARLSNVTIARNRGGGLSISNGVSVTLASSTIAGNRADTGGGIRNAGGTVLLKNSLVAGNTISATGGADCAGAITSIGYSLIGQTAGCTVATSIGDLLDVDPQLNAWLLGAPAYYALRSNSPAIDAGNPIGCTDANGMLLPTDVRGVARSGRCDIGSYEYVTPTLPAQLTILTGSPQYTRPSTLFADLLRVAVLDANGSPVNSGVPVTFTAPASGASGTFSDTQSATTTALTDVDGIATAPPFRSNDQTGSYVVTALASGAPPVSFQLFNSAAWYVAPTGSNANSCLLPAAPCATINGALAKAQSNDEIFVAAGTYTGAGDAVVTLNKNVRVSGGWNASFTAQTGATIIDSENARRGMMVPISMTVTLDHFVIRNGSTGAGSGIFNAGDLTTDQLTFQANTCPGIDSYGGSVYNAGKLVMAHTVITGSNCFFGSGLFNASGSTAVLTDFVSIENSGWRGLGLNNQGTLTLTQGLLGYGGYTDAYGGGLYNSGRAMVISTTIAQGYAYAGGGIYNEGQLIVRGSTIISNSTHTYVSGRTMGAGLYNSAGTLLLENSIVQSNVGYGATTWTTTPSAPAFGGGIFNTGIMTVNNSLLTDNGVTKLDNAVDPPLGGGAYNTGALTFNNTTIVGNRSLSGGNAGGLFNETGTLTLHNTIVVSNTAEGTNPDCAGTISSAGYNLIGTVQGCDFQSASGDQLNAAVRFMPSTTPIDFRLRHDSPALNSGDPIGCVDPAGQPLPIDLRGLPRPIGRCDMGAVEMQALESSSLEPSRVNVRPGNWVSYTLTLRNNALADWDHVISTNTLPAELHYQAESLSVSTGEAQYNNGIITWTAALSGSAQHNLTYGAQVDVGIRGGSTIQNSALIDGAGTLTGVSSTIYARWETALPLLLRDYCGDFFDDFSYPQGWPIVDNAYVRAEYLNGEYRILTRQSGNLYIAKSLGCTQGDQVIEVDARWDAAHGDGYALVFDITPGFDRYVVFYVSPDYGEFALWHEMNGILQLAPFTHSDAVKTGGATNHLKAVVRGYDITLILNGVTLGTWPDGLLTRTGGAGVAVAPRVTVPTADVRFDNFAMYRAGSVAALPAPIVLPDLPGPAATPDRAATNRSAWKPYRITADRLLP